LPKRKSNAFHLLLFALFLTACASSTPTISSKPTSTSSAITPPATAQPTLTAPSPSATPDNLPALQFPARALIHDLRWSPDGSQLAIAAGTDIHLYDANPSTGSGQALVEQHILPVGVWTERIAFHPSEPILGAATKDGSIRFWNTTDGAEICKFTAHAKGANSLAFQPNGSLLATTGTDIISRLWDISSVLAGACDVKPAGLLIGSSYTAPDAAFSADGQQFALVDIKNIYLRNSQTRKLIAILKSGLPVFDIALSPDGHWLAAAQNNATVTLWDLSAKPRPTSTVLHLPTGKSPTYLWRVDFSSDSGLLAGGASDGALLVWELPGLQAVFSHKLSNAISGLAFQPITYHLTVGTLDGSVYIYSLAK
jgi:WD40 repeat protein